MRKQKVLFLCTQNSARSQMAEGFLRHYAGERFEAYSAGVRPSAAVYPEAVEVMEEVGIDISEQYPKGLSTYMGKMGFNYLVIVCARAEAECPKTFPGVGTRFSWVFDDPRAEEVPEPGMLDEFRKVRDEIEAKILRWLEHPEEEMEKLKVAREIERLERLEALRRDTDSPEAFATAIEPRVSDATMSAAIPPAVARGNRIDLVSASSRLASGLADC